MGTLAAAVMHELGWLRAVPCKHSRGNGSPPATAAAPAQPLAACPAHPTCPGTAGAAARHERRAQRSRSGRLLGACATAAASAGQRRRLAGPRAGLGSGIALDTACGNGGAWAARTINAEGRGFARALATACRSGSSNRKPTAHLGMCLEIRHGTFRASFRTVEFRRVPLGARDGC